MSKLLDFSPKEKIQKNLNYTSPFRNASSGDSSAKKITSKSKLAAFKLTKRKRKSVNISEVLGIGAASAAGASAIGASFAGASSVGGSAAGALQTPEIFQNEMLADRPIRFGRSSGPSSRQTQGSGASSGSPEHTVDASGVGALYQKPGGPSKPTYDGISNNFLRFAGSLGQRETSWSDKEARTDANNQPDNNKNVKRYGAEAKDYGYFQTNRRDVKDAIKRGIPPEIADALDNGAGKGKYTPEQQTKALHAYLQKKYPIAFAAIERGDWATAHAQLKGQWPSLPGGLSYKSVNEAAAARILEGKLPSKMTDGIIPSLDKNSNSSQLKAAREYLEEQIKSAPETDREKIQSQIDAIKGHETSLEKRKQDGAATLPGVIPNSENPNLPGGNVAQKNVQPFSMVLTHQSGFAREKTWGDALKKHQRGSDSRGQGWGYHSAVISQYVDEKGNRIDEKEYDELSSSEKAKYKEIAEVHALRDLNTRPNQSKEHNTHALGIVTLGKLTPAKAEAYKNYLAQLIADGKLPPNALKKIFGHGEVQPDEGRGTMEKGKPEGSGIASYLRNIQAEILKKAEAIKKGQKPETNVPKPDDLSKIDDYIPHADSWSEVQKAIQADIKSGRRNADGTLNFDKINGTPPPVAAPPDATPAPAGSAAPEIGSSAAGARAAAETQGQTPAAEPNATPAPPPASSIKKLEDDAVQQNAAPNPTTPRQSTPPTPPTQPPTNIENVKEAQSNQIFNNGSKNSLASTVAGYWKQGGEKIHI